MTAEQARKLSDKAKEKDKEAALRVDLPEILSTITKEAKKGYNEYHHLRTIHIAVQDELKALGYTLLVAQMPKARPSETEKYINQELLGISYYKTIIRW